MKIRIHDKETVCVCVRGTHEKAVNRRETCQEKRGRGIPYRIEMLLRCARCVLFPHPSHISRSKVDFRCAFCVEIRWQHRNVFLLDTLSDDFYRISWVVV